MYSTNFRFCASMYESFSSRGRFGRVKLAAMSVPFASVLTAVKVDNSADNADCGSNGPMGGRENFANRACAYDCGWFCGVNGRGGACD